MATVEMEVLQLGPHSNGMPLSPWEFDAAEFEPGWRYELVMQRRTVEGSLF